MQETEHFKQNIL